MTSPELHSRVSTASVKSAERTLDVLELLSASLRPVPTMVIARRCGIPKSSAHHLLNVMRARGWLVYYEHDRGWGLGAVAYDTGSAYLRSQPLRRLGHPALTELTESTGQASQLTVLHGDEAVYIEQACPRRGAPTAAYVVPAVHGVGVRLPAHLTAGGRAMLAWLAAEQVRALYVHPVLPRLTECAPVTVSRLLSELQEVRARGYATQIGLTTPGLGSIGAAVLSHEGRPVAAIEVTFVPEHEQERCREELAAAACAAARRLTDAIGPRRGSMAHAV